MRGTWKSLRLACAAAAVTALLPGAPRAAPCDEYDPFGPSRSARITLDSSDFLDDAGTEIRSFVATDSLGNVDVRLVSASRGTVVRDVSAVPDISMLSPHFGERLKGIHVAVSLASAGRPVRVVLDLRQVCAQHFRNTFLYY